MISGTSCDNTSSRNGNKEFEVILIAPMILEQMVKCFLSEINIYHLFRLNIRY